MTTPADGLLAVHPEGIPAELKALPAWVTWKASERKSATGETRLTKIPFTPDGARKASSTKPEDWGRFEEAFQTYEKGGVSGVGFVFSPSFCVVGIDLDHCLEDGELHPAARRIVERFASFTEISVSGTGLHILVKGVLPWPGKRLDPVEVYGEGRYFTMTGAIYQGHGELKECQNGLDSFVSHLWPREDVEGPGAERDRRGRDRTFRNDPSDEELIKKAMNAANGMKFRSLFEGAWEALGYPSQSEADSALASMLLYWCDNDVPRAERIFRTSALFRKKFERPDYRRRLFRLCGGAR
jgi:putative DNA primase/helicase